MVNKLFCLPMAGALPIELMKSLIGGGVSNVHNFSSCLVHCIISFFEEYIEF